MVTTGCQEGHNSLTPPVQSRPGFFLVKAVYTTHFPLATGCRAFIFLDETEGFQSTPVEPKPPSPRSVEARLSFSDKTTCDTGATTS